MLSIVLSISGCGPGVTADQMNADVYALSIPKVEMIGSMDLFRQTLPNGESRVVRYLSTASEAKIREAFDANFSRSGFRRLPGRTPDGAYKYQGGERRRALLIEPEGVDKRRVTVFMFFPQVFPDSNA